MDAKLEQSIKDVAQQAARIRWNMPTWSGFDITIKRIEQVDDNTWNAVYDEPDTVTEEDMTVERVGNALEAMYTGDVLARLQLPEGEGTATTEKDGPMESGDVQLAPPSETPWNHSVSLHQGRLALYWEVRPAPDRVETRIRMFTRDETEVLMTFLYDSRELIYHPDQQV